MIYKYNWIEKYIWHNDKRKTQETSIKFVRRLVADKYTKILYLKKFQGLKIHSIRDNFDIGVDES